MKAYLKRFAFFLVVAWIMSAFLVLVDALIEKTQPSPAVCYIIIIVLICAVIAYFNP